MIGYVQNISPGWTHALKRAVRPGGKIMLDELYAQYGVKHGMDDGQEFVDWLKDIKLTDRNRWKVVYDDGTSVVNEVSVEDTPEEQRVKDVSKMPDNVATIVPKEMTVDDVVGLSVRKAREILPNITDLKLLRYSLQQASTLAGKDSLCRILRKRIATLNVAR